MFRRRTKIRDVACFMLAVLLALPFFAVDSRAGERASEIEELKAQIRELQRRVDKLSAEDNSDKKSAKVDISLKKGTGLTIKSADDNYKLRTRLRGQFLAKYNDVIDVDDDEKLEFRIRRLRVTWDGNVFRKWMKYKVQVDLSRDAELKDMLLLFAYDEMFSPKVGQYKVPFNREVQNSSSALQLVGRSILNDAFEFDRDIGFGLVGTDKKFWKYELMLSNGEGPAQREQGRDTGLLWSGRLMFSPTGTGLKVKPNFAKKPSLQIGAAIAGIDIEDLENKPEASNIDSIADRFNSLTINTGQLTSVTADISFATPLFNVEGEYNGRWISDDDPVLTDGVFDQGFRVQGGIFIIPKTVEFAARYAYVDMDDDVAGDFDNSWAITPGINYYLSKDHRWKLQLDYSFIREEDFNNMEKDENVFQAQVQAYF